MKRKGHPRIEINDIHDFNCVCSDIVDEFLEDFPERKGLTETIHDYDGFIPDGVAYMYTQRAMNMYEKFERRLQVIAEVNFPDSYHDFELDCSNMIMD